jgi:putative peptide zinc metalloprotease protein
VSAAWQLKRWQRVVVDLGGTFFQFVIGAMYILIFLCTGWVPAQVAFAMILYSALFSLNPILRFDGYWVVADALGVTNLAKQPRRVFRHLFDRLLRRPVKPLPWSTKVTRIMTLYTLISFGFWGYFTLRIIPFVWNAISAYPYRVAGLIDYLLVPPHIPSLDQAQAFLAATFTVFIALLMSVNLSRMLIKPVLSLATHLVWEKRGFSHPPTNT